MFQTENKTRNGREERGIRTRKAEYRYYELSLLSADVHENLFAGENDSKDSPRCNYAVVIHQHRYRLWGDMLLQQC